MVIITGVQFNLDISETNLGTHYEVQRMAQRRSRYESPSEGAAAASQRGEYVYYSAVREITRHMTMAR